MNKTYFKHLIFACLAIIIRIKAQFVITDDVFNNDYSPSMNDIIHESRTENYDDNNVWTITVSSNVRIDNDGEYRTCKQTNYSSTWNCTSSIFKQANETYHINISYTFQDLPIMIAVIGTESNQNKFVRTFSSNPEFYPNDYDGYSSDGWQWIIFIIFIWILIPFIFCLGLIGIIFYCLRTSSIVCCPRSSRREVNNGNIEMIRMENVIVVNSSDLEGNQVNNNFIANPAQIYQINPQYQNQSAILYQQQGINRDVTNTTNVQLAPQ